MAGEALPSQPELRLMPPSQRSALQRWSVWLDGVHVGEIQEKHLGGARLPFYDAIVTSPRTGKPVSLELHTDINNRVAVIVEFHRDPLTAQRHWR